MREASRLSQSYIIAAPSADDCDAQAARLAARAVCSGAEPKPCGKCRDCRKAAAGIHPDIIDVRRMTDDKGRPKREIMVDQVRAMAADASILPNEAERKVYVIHEAELMNESLGSIRKAIHEIGEDGKERHQQRVDSQYQGTFPGSY